MRTATIDGIKYQIERTGMQAANGLPMVFATVIGRRGKPTKRIRVGLARTDGSFALCGWLPS